jgi:hypothetical protein
MPVCAHGLGGESAASAPRTGVYGQWAPTRAVSTRCIRAMARDHGHRCNSAHTRRGAPWPLVTMAIGVIARTHTEKQDGHRCIRAMAGDPSPGPERSLTVARAVAGMPPAAPAALTSTTPRVTGNLKPSAGPGTLRRERSLSGRCPCRRRHAAGRACLRRSRREHEACLRRRSVKPESPGT